MTVEGDVVVGVVGHTVDVGEMGTVSAVFGDGLHGPVDNPFIFLIFGPIVVTDFGEDNGFIGRLFVVRVIPGPDEAVCFLAWVCSLPGRLLHLRRNGFRIRDLLGSAFTVPTPRVERAFEVVAVHFTAIAHVRTQVWAISVENARQPILAAPDDQLLFEIVQRFDFADGQLVAVAHGEPAERHGQIDAAFLGATSVGHRVNTPAFEGLFIEVLKLVPYEYRRRTGILNVDGFTHESIPR